MSVKQGLLHTTCTFNISFCPGNLDLPEEEFCVNEVYTKPWTEVDYTILTFHYNDDTDDNGDDECCV